MDIREVKTARTFVVELDETEVEAIIVALDNTPRPVCEHAMVDPSVLKRLADQFANVRYPDLAVAVEEPGMQVYDAPDAGEADFICNPFDNIPYHHDTPFDPRNSRYWL